MDVQTGAGGQAKVDLTAIAEDLIPAADETYDLGSEDKKWAALWVAIALVTSITIGGVVNISTIDSWLFINASTWINESLNVSGNITAVNITADYFFGNGSQLTDITLTETDPYWLANYSDFLTISAWNDTGLIRDWNSSSLIIDWNASGYIIDWNASGYIIDWNATGLIANWSYTETDPYWTGNKTNVAFTNVNESFDYSLNVTGNLTLTTANYCIIFDSGGKICSGV